MLTKREFKISVDEFSKIFSILLVFYGLQIIIQPTNTRTDENCFCRYPIGQQELPYFTEWVQEKLNVKLDERNVPRDLPRDFPPSRVAPGNYRGTQSSQNTRVIHHINTHCTLYSIVFKIVITTGFVTRFFTKLRFYRYRYSQHIIETL